MNLKDIIFVSNYPSIDLHGYDRDSARIAINDFIKENIKLKNEVFVIIHGIGTGILRNTTKEVLLKNKNVLEFQICYNNIGSTLVRIKI